MPHESRDLHPSMTVNWVVLFMGQINVLQEDIASVPGETSESQPTSALVARSPFTAQFVPNRMLKRAKCGVFIARNQIQNLQIWRTMLISLISVTSFVVRLLIDLELFKLLSFIFGCSLVLAVEFYYHYYPCWDFCLWTCQSLSGALKSKCNCKCLLLSSYRSEK